MTAILKAKKNVWSIEQRRRTLGCSNHIRKTVASLRSLLLNSTTMTPIPRFKAGSDPGEATTSAVLDFPKNPLPSEGAYFPMNTQSMAASIHNETECQLGTLKTVMRFDVLGQNARSTEKQWVQTKNITVDELIEDAAVSLRMMQDMPLLPEENLMLVSIAPRDSYLSVPRDRNEIKMTILKDEEKLHQFYEENFMLGYRSNVTHSDIKSEIMINMDPLCKLNKTTFPDGEVWEVARTARKRFDTNLLAHLSANMKAAKIGTPKRMFKKQPGGAEKVSLKRAKIKTENKKLYLAN